MSLLSQSLLPSTSALKGSSSMKDEIYEIQGAIVSFFKRCNLRYSTDSYDNAFDVICRAEAARRGLNKKSLHKFITCGVALVTTAFKHIPDDSTRIWIAITVAVLIYVDDVASEDADYVRRFSERYVANAPQADSVLDELATLLHETALHFSAVGCSIVLASVLNFLAGTLIEVETEGMEMSKDASEYPSFMRAINAGATAYFVFIFPRDIPVKSYIQAFPDIVKYNAYVNDILSFYKEEISAEPKNYISGLADVSKTTKMEAFRRVVDEAAAADENVLRILAPHAAALKAYQEFRQGYIAFHAVLGRYKLDELELTV